MCVRVAGELSSRFVYQINLDFFFFLFFARGLVSPISSLPWSLVVYRLSISYQFSSSSSSSYPVRRSLFCFEFLLLLLLMEKQKRAHTHCCALLRYSPSPWRCSIERAQTEEEEGRNGTFFLSFCLLLAAAAPCIRLLVLSVHCVLLGLAPFPLFFIFTDSSSKKKCAHQMLSFFFPFFYYRSRVPLPLSAVQL